MSVQARDTRPTARPLPAEREHPPARVRRRPALAYTGMAALLLTLAAAALLVGPTHIPPATVARALAAHLLHLHQDVPVTADQIIWQIRLPRVLLAALVGATLAGTGTAYQGVFRNPLAEPYLIGVAAGAALGATLVFVSPFGGSWHGVTLVTPAAFVGATLAVAVAYALARGGGAASGPGLILAGIAIAALCNAVTSFLFFARGDRLLTIFAWLMGGFNTASWARVAVLALYAVPCLAVLFLSARLLNVLLLDEEQARHLGVDVERVKLVVLVAASLAAAAAVSVSGLIGFVGLVVPHVARLLVGPDHRRLLPLSLGGGAALLIGADLAARTVLGGVEIPVGIVTALVGAPFFLFLLQRRRRAW